MDYAVGTILMYVASIWVLILLSGVLDLIALWRIFVKAGKPGWISIIPIYNIYSLFEIVGIKGWYIFVGFIPVFGWIFISIITIIAYVRLAECFNKNTVFIFGLILFNTIFMCILAFDNSSVYNKIKSNL